MTNYTQVPNELLEMWCSDPTFPAKIRPYFLIIRQTLGYHKDRDDISLTQFEKLCKLDRKSVTRSIKFLEESGLIRVERHGLKTSTIILNNIGIEKSYGGKNATSQNLVSGKNATSIVAKMPPQVGDTVVAKMPPTKETYKGFKKKAECAPDGVTHQPGNTITFDYSEDEDDGYEQ